MIFSRRYFRIFSLLTAFLLSAAEMLHAAPAEAGTVKKKPNPIRYVFYSNVRYVLLYDVADFYGLTSTYTKKGVVLYSPARRVEMFYEKREGSINGVRTYFLAPVLYLDKKPYITESDFLRVIDPALRKKLIRKQHEIKTIMLDPGHGGSDPGAKGPVLPEKQINLLIAQKLRKALEKLGYKVLMTREKDVFPTLPDRTNQARKFKPDLFISIHCNSAANTGVTGIETFLLTPSGAASTADKTAQAQSFEANTYDQNNYRLAYEVQKSLLQFTGSEDRGVRHARFYVLRNSCCPSILIECGFLSNKNEGTLLASNAFQNKITAGILSGLARYADAVRPPVKNQNPSAAKPVMKTPTVDRRPAAVRSPVSPSAAKPAAAKPVMKTPTVDRRPAVPESPVVSPSAVPEQPPVAAVPEPSIKVPSSDSSELSENIGEKK